MYQVNQRRRKSKDIWVILLGQTKQEKNIYLMDDPSITKKNRKTFGQQQILFDKSEREKPMVD